MAISFRLIQYRLHLKCWSAYGNVFLHQSVHSAERLQGQACFPWVHTFSRNLHCQLHSFFWSIFRVSSLSRNCQLSLESWSAPSTQFCDSAFLWTSLVGTSQCIPNQSTPIPWHSAFSCFQSVKLSAIFGFFWHFLLLVISHHDFGPPSAKLECQACYTTLRYYRHLIPGRGLRDKS